TGRIIKNQCIADIILPDTGLLLRALAQAAQRGERVPTPGEPPANIDERVMICPLTNSQFMTKANSIFISSS
ncbi:TPA: hypothetical protein ACHIDF_005223, partial [Escherichia coli]